jgi:hypothetical protein
MSLIVAASLCLCGIHKICVERLDGLGESLHHQTAFYVSRTGV